MALTDILYLVTYEHFSVMSIVGRKTSHQLSKRHVRALGPVRRKRFKRLLRLSESHGVFIDFSGGTTLPSVNIFSEECLVFKQAFGRQFRWPVLVIGCVPGGRSTTKRSSLDHSIEK